MGIRQEKKCTTEDAFLWRKYGQKDILHSKYPRLYFRCSYKNDRGCTARKQVQQSDANPSLYTINYFGEQTCCPCPRRRVVDHHDVSQAILVIGFSAGDTTSGGGGADRQCSSDDEALTSSDGEMSSQVWSSLEEEEEEEELRADMSKLAQLIEEGSMPVPELMG